MTNVVRLEGSQTVEETLLKVVADDPDQVIVLSRNKGDEYWTLDYSHGIDGAQRSHAAVCLFSAHVVEVGQAYEDEEE